MKTALITGASDGIGEQAAIALKDLGWQVAIIGRNKARTEAVARRLNAPHYLADFAKLSEVKALGAQLLRDFPRIDVLANNAGGMFSKQPLTEDGFEMTFQVNHLAHFLLTRMLMPTLITSRASVINTSSVAHKSIGLLFKLDDVAKPKHYSQHLAYGNAKLANILFTKELHRRYHAQGLNAARSLSSRGGRQFVCQGHQLLHASAVPHGPQARARGDHPQRGRADAGLAGDECAWDKLAFRRVLCQATARQNHQEGTG